MQTMSAMTLFFDIPEGLTMRGAVREAHACDLRSRETREQGLIGKMMMTRKRQFSKRSMGSRRLKMTPAPVGTILAALLLVNTSESTIIDETNSGLQ